MVQKNRKIILAALSSAFIALAVYAQSNTSTSGTSATSKMNSNEIKQIQTRLNDKGYHVAVDGVMGSETVAALKQFQQAQGDTPTGTADSKTLSQLGVSTESQQAATAPSDQTSQNPESTDMGNQPSTSDQTSAGSQPGQEPGTMGGNMASPGVAPANPNMPSQPSQANPPTTGQDQGTAPGGTTGTAPGSSTGGPSGSSNP